MATPKASLRLCMYKQTVHETRDRTHYTIFFAIGYTSVSTQKIIIQVWGIDRAGVCAKNGSIICVIHNPSIIL